jgi:predicted nucleic acid-binding protein
LRIATNRRVFDPPSPLAEVAAFAEGASAAPGYLAVPGMQAGIGPFLTRARAASAGANLIPDAYIAAYATVLGASVATFDTDFHRFRGLPITTPGA